VDLLSLPADELLPKSREVAELSGVEGWKGRCRFMQVVAGGPGRLRPRASSPSCEVAAG
jgi:hypothetical protein